eukprot:jgi/Bigna1/146103/aug1.109_g20811
MGARNSKEKEEGIGGGNNSATSSRREGKEIVCMASKGTRYTVQKVARQHGLSVVQADTVGQTLELLRNPRNSKRWIAVVAALGTKRGVNAIFDLAGDRSSVIDAAKKLPGCHVVIFSHTACRKRSCAQACEDAGADAVLCTEDALEDYLHVAKMLPVVEKIPFDAAAAAARKGARRDGMVTETTTTTTAKSHDGEGGGRGRGGETDDDVKSSSVDFQNKTIGDRAVPRIDHHHHHQQQQQQRKKRGTRRGEKDGGCF